MDPTMNNPILMNQVQARDQQDALSHKIASSSRSNNNINKVPGILEGNSLVEMTSLNRPSQANPITLQHFYPVDDYRNASLSEILLSSEDIFGDDSCEPIPICNSANGENVVAPQRTVSKEDQEWNQLDDSLLLMNHLKNQQQVSQVPVAAELVENIQATKLQILQQHQQLQQQMALMQMQAATVSQQLGKRTRVDEQEDPLLGSLFSQMNHGSSSVSYASAPSQDTERTGPKFRKYQEGQWAEKFRELCQYKQEFGHCLVPHTYTSNLALARWVKRQRYQYKLMNEGKLCTMTQERVDALKNIGFVWDSQGAAWSERLEELKEFRQQFGTCNVPSNYEDNNQLATWVKCQRRQFKLFNEGKPSNITLDRIQQLNALGFEWELRNVHKKARSSY